MQTFAKSKIKPVGGEGSAQRPETTSRTGNSSFDDGRAQQNIVAEAEAFLLQRVHFIQADPTGSIISGSEYQVEDDKFMKFLESAANGQINLQDLHTFSIEPRQRSDSCKAALSYLLNLKSKATVLLQQLKLSQLTSSSQNEVQQDNARLKAKLKLLENVKKDQLMKKLDAKEHECLEYRARLDRSAQPASFTLDESSLTPVAILEAEVERKMKELKQEMQDSRAKIAGLVQDMQIIKTTTREKILVPFIADHSEMAELDELESRRVPMDFRIDNAESQIAQQQEESQVNDETRGIESEGNEEVKISPEVQAQQRTIGGLQPGRHFLDRGQTLPLQGLGSQRMLQPQLTLQGRGERHSVQPNLSLHPSANQGSHPTLPKRGDSLQLSVAQHRRQQEEQYEAYYLEQLDEQQHAQLASIYAAVQTELEALTAMEVRLLQEKTELHLETTRIKAKESQILLNNRILEHKLQETMALKSEQNVKLKSELQILKAKLERQKQKNREALATFETKKINEMRQQSEDEVALKLLEIEQLQKHLEAKNQGMAALEAQIQDLNQKISASEIDFQQQNHEQNVIINELSEQLKGINETHSNKLTQIDQIRENTQKRLNLEEQERTMNSLKLDYLVNNNRKLQNQKRYLIKTLDNDLKKLSNEMRKSEIEMQRDAFITSQNAQGRLKQIYTVVKESLGYVKEVVEFMNFELGDQIHGKLQADEDPAQELPKRVGSKPELQPSENTESTPAKLSNIAGEQKPLDYYFYKHIHEIAEAVLSVLCELYQEGQTQTQLEVVHLFTLIQSKTDKSIVSDIYNRFFAQNRIHFLQSVQRTINRNATLEREKAEMRRKLEELNKALTRGSRTQLSLPREATPRNAVQADEEPTIPVVTQQHRTLSPEAVINGLQRFQERKIIESQEEEISALKQRMKEVRLNLQRQICDLQDQLSLAKEHNQASLTQLRLEYGRDLSALHKSHLLKEDELKADIEGAYQDRLETLKSEQQGLLKDLQSTFENELENRRKDLERSELMREEVMREIRKLKKRSIGNAQGGWGTFSIVFEDNIKKHHALTLMHAGTLTSGTGMPMKRESREYDSLSQKSDEIGGASRLGEESKKTSPEQLSHFIEVGFMMNQRNFKHLDTYKESTFESKITKHLFELQDPLSSDRAVQLQNRLRSQLYENFALFTEINPIYVSFNLGRNVSPFWDENSLSQEHFKLIKREAVYLAGEHYLTINFLRCDDPQLVIRIIAFDNDSCTSYNFDLIYEDLMLFVDGNMRLLDPDNQHDLCQMLMNNMTRFNSRENLHDHDGGDESGGEGDHTRSENGDDTMEAGEAKYNRMITSGTGGGAGAGKEPRAEITLAIEHKIYFNETYRNEYERNKLIIAKNDKRKKGLLQDRSLNTDFDKSIVYEAFDILYTDVLALSAHNNGSVQSQLSLGLLAGRMSGHKVLKLAFETLKDGQSDAKTVFMQDLCLYESDCTKQRLAQQTASIIVKIPEEHQLDRVLALVVSFERLCNSDNFIIRVVEVQRYDDEAMSRYQWDPMGPPGNGSLRHTEHTVYLVRKNNGEYVRLMQHEILNTEIRALLFRHSYGYSQAVVEFGGRLHSDTIRLRDPVEQHVNRLKKGVRTEGMNFLIRDFGIVRVKNMNNMITNSPKNEAIREMIGGAQSRIQHDVDSEEGEDNNVIEMEEDEELFSLSNHYCAYSFYDDFKCLSRGEIYIRIHLDAPYYIDLTQKLSGIAQFLQLQPEEFGKLLSNSAASQRAKLLQQVFDQLVVINSVNSETGLSRFRVTVDPKAPKMSELVDRLKKERLLQQVDQRDMLENELDCKTLGITLNVLAECEKTTQVSIVNRKVFKITSFYVNNIKNLKLRTQSEKVFDWQFIYVEAESRFSTKSMVIAVTEDDIRQLLTALLERQGSDGKQLIKVEGDILAARLSRSKRVIEFILDALVIDEMHTGTLKLSLQHLLARMQDRILLQQYFKFTGGRYLPTPIQGQIAPTLSTNQSLIGSGDSPLLSASGDIELRHFKTSLPSIEMSRTLLVNIEKDFSDKRYDLRLYEVTVKHQPHQKKYSFEMYPVESQDTVLFRFDFLSQALLPGKKLMIERFNIIQQMYQDFEENKFIKDGFVLSVLEQGFPHSITLLLLEPVSHIQWQYTITDDKLNPIENRHDKEYFVKTCKNLIEQGLWFNQMQASQPGLVPTPQPIVGELMELGYQKHPAQQQIELYQGKLRDVFAGDEKNKSPMARLIYQRQIEVVPAESTAGGIDEAIYTDVSLTTQNEYGTVRLTINSQEVCEIAVREAKRESARFIAGFAHVKEKARVFYCIEQSCGYTDQERAFRLLVSEPKSGRILIDFVLAEKHIVSIQPQQSFKNGVPSFNLYSIKEEVKFAFNTGFKDAFALYQKLPELLTDFKQAFIVNEERLRFSPPIDESRVLLRKVVNIKEDFKTFLIFLKCDSLATLSDRFKIHIFEQSSSYEETFCFKTEQIITKDEQIALAQAKNDQATKGVLQKVVDTRLKLRALGTPNDVQLVITEGTIEGHQRYVAYFLDAEALASATGAAPPSDTAASNGKFDIRNGSRFDLVKPEVQLKPATDFIPQERLISQLEREPDLLFDVSEVLNPYQLILRIKTFDSVSLKVLSVSEITEKQMTEELTRDQMTYLLREPHRREELAKYFVQNAHYDELKKCIYFLQSSIPLQEKRSTAVGTDAPAPAKKDPLNTQSSISSLGRQRRASTDFAMM